MLVAILHEIQWKWIPLYVYLWKCCKIFPTVDNSANRTTIKKKETFFLNTSSFHTSQSLYFSLLCIFYTYSLKSILSHSPSLSHSLSLRRASLK